MAWTGCKDASNSAADNSVKPVDPVADRDRPPLRILLISQPTALEEVLRLRWSSVSEQRLQFEAKDAREIDFTKFPQADLVIAPQNILGSLVESKVVLALPSEVADRFNTEAAKVDPAGPEVPTHWLKSFTYGKKLFAVPFGSTLQLLAIPSAVESAPGLQVLSEDSTRIGMRSVQVDWSRVKLAKPTESSDFLKPDLVDHFVALAAAHRPNNYESSFLFKLVDCSSRVSEPWMVEAALELRKLYSDSDATRITVELGWPTKETPVDAKWAVAVVSRESNNEANAQEASSAASAPAESAESRLLVDSGRGPGVFLCSKTRQSSKATFFLNWLCEPAQAIAIAKAWDWSYPTPASADEARTKSYAEIAYRVSMADDISTMFQINHGLQYRSILAKTLEEIVRDENLDALQALEKCRQAHNALTQSLGQEQQQDSLERSMGLRD